MLWVLAAPLLAGPITIGEIEIPLGLDAFAQQAICLDPGGCGAEIAYLVARETRRSPAGAATAPPTSLLRPRSLLGMQADAEGTATVVRQTAERYCGVLAQAIDRAACELSGVVTLP